ncbi:MAG: T9SS type A sorting domain-containing protein [Crocinitomicaceae bacterium]
MSLEDLGIDLFVVYPNPTNDQLTIAKKSDMNIDEIRLYNAAGQLVYEQTPEPYQDQMIDVSIFANGLYYLVLNVEGTYAKTKVMIQH